MVIELYRVRCPDCGIKAEKIEQVQRFEEIVGQACGSAAARQVARRFGLAESTVGALDLRYLERWAAATRKPALRSDQDRIRGLQESSLKCESRRIPGEPEKFGTANFRDKPSLEKCIHASIQHHPDVKLILRRSLAENTRSYPTGHPLAGG